MLLKVEMACTQPFDPVKTHFNAVISNQNIYKLIRECYRIERTITTYYTTDFTGIASRLCYRRT